MQNQYELKDGCLVVQVPKELDHHSADILREETDALIGNYQVHVLVFDFQKTEFMDSSGIGVVIGRYKNMYYKGGKVEATNLNERVKKIFVVSGLSKIVLER